MKSCLFKPNTQRGLALLQSMFAECFEKLQIALNLNQNTGGEGYWQVFAASRLISHFLVGVRIAKQFSFLLKLMDIALHVTESA